VGASTDGDAAMAACREAIRTIERLRDNYRRRAKWHRYWFRISGVLVIVLSALLPLLAGLSFDAKDGTLAAVGVTIAIVTGLRVFFQWDQLWGLLRQSDFALSHLLANWELDVAAAAELPEPERRSTLFALSRDVLAKADQIRQAESQKFFGALRFPGGAAAGEGGAGVEPAK
jgi:hypothetical protein